MDSYQECIGITTLQNVTITSVSALHRLKYHQHNQNREFS